MSNNDPANSIRSLVRPAQRSLFTSRAAAPSRSSLANSVARQSAGGLSLAQRATNTSHKRPAEGVAREDATKRQQAPSSVPPPVEPQPITNAGHIRAEAGQQDPEGETAGAPAKGASASAEAVGSQPGASQILPRRQAENDRKPALSDTLVRNSILSKLGEGAANPRIVGLAERLATGARTSRAISTWDVYDPIIGKWVTFCAEIGEDPVAASGVAASLFLQERMEDAGQRGIGPQAVTKASAAITALHSIAGATSPSSDPLCSVVREVAKRSLTAQPLTRDPVSADDIKRIVDTHLATDTPLQTRMYATFAVLCFKGLFRYSDLARVMVHERLMEFSDGKVVIRLYAGKTDQYGDGKSVTIFEEAAGSPYCAVRLLKRLLAEGQYKTRPDTRTWVDAAGTRHTEEVEDVGPLMRAVKNVQGRHVLAQTSVPLPNVIPAVSYTTYRKQLLELCTAAGITKKVGTHSFRSGGASAAVNGGADPRLVQEHGRWKSAAVFAECYVHDSDERKRAVQACMGLGDTD